MIEIKQYEITRILFEDSLATNTKDTLDCLSYKTVSSELHESISGNTWDPMTMLKKHRYQHIHNAR